MSFSDLDEVDLKFTEPGDQSPMSADELGRILDGDLAGWEEIAIPGWLHEGESIYFIVKGFVCGGPTRVHTTIFATEATALRDREACRLFRRARC